MKSLRVESIADLRSNSGTTAGIDTPRAGIDEDAVHQ